MDLTVVGELDGVAQQVGDDLPDAPGVAGHQRRRVAVDLHQQLQPLLVGLGRKQPGGPLHDVTKVEAGDLQLEPAGLDLGEVQDVVDHLEEGLAGAPG